MVLITTDRQSAFDRVLAAVLFKGQVLNMTSAWWFEQTRHIVPNQVLPTPAPNVTIAEKCTVFPIEFVMRGYITGTTAGDTSSGVSYCNSTTLASECMVRGIELRGYCSGHHIREVQSWAQYP